MDMKLDKAISTLAAQAAGTGDANEALKYSQASLNLANTKRALGLIKDGAKKE